MREGLLTREASCCATTIQHHAPGRTRCRPLARGSGRARDERGGRAGVLRRHASGSWKRESRIAVPASQLSLDLHARPVSPPGVEARCSGVDNCRPADLRSARRHLPERPRSAMDRLSPAANHRGTGGSSCIATATVRRPCSMSRASIRTRRCPLDSRGQGRVLRLGKEISPCPVHSHG